MSLSNLINYAISKSSDNTINHTLEFEIRFGKYNQISSNIKPNAFYKVYKLGNSHKTYELTTETFFNSSDKEPIRHRLIYKDANNAIKNMFDNQSNKLIKRVSKINKLPNKLPIDTIVDLNPSDIMNVVKEFGIHSSDIYISKTKLMKGNSNNLYKAEIVSENIQESPSNKNATLKKYKLRCSWLENMWIHDLTIVLIEDIKSGKSGVFYEIEIEYSHVDFIKNKYTFDDILRDVNKNINAITTIIDCAKLSDIEIEIKYGLFNAVETMERHRLELLQTAEYSVVDKADGERKFIYIDDAGGIFYFNPTEGYITKIPLVKNTKITLGSTLIDCELINVNNDKSRFYGFDILFFKNEDCRNYNLIERLKMLDKTIKELNKYDKTSKYEYAIKKFYTTDVFKNAALIWENRKKLFPYNLDGLIFTPIQGAYLGNLPNLKYKPLVSIDVRIMYYRDTNFTEFYANGYPIEIKGRIINAYKDNKTQKTYYKSRVSINDNQLKSLKAINSNGILGMTGRIENMPDMVDIIEMEFEPHTKQWKFLRTRPDKENANAFKTILSALNAIKDNITIDEISKLSHTKSPYEESLEHKECFTQMGFNFASNSITSPLCTFYKFAYSSIIKLSDIGTKKPSILVLGCNLCLLNSLIDLCEQTDSEILIIESNCLEVYAENKSEGYQGLIETLNKISTNKHPAYKKIKIIVGNTNISNGLVAYNKKDQTELNTYKKTKFDLVFIQSFENSFYANGNYNQPIYNKYIAELKKISKTVIGLFMSGDKILSHLETQDCIIMRNKELHPLWKLQIDKDITDIKNLSKDISIFKNKGPVQTYNIKKIQNSFMSETHPIIFDSNITDLLKDSFGILGKSIRCGSLKSFFGDYKRQSVNFSDVNTQLSEYDCIIADITKYFIF
jgi:hypothetical protein